MSNVVCEVFGCLAKSVIKKDDKIAPDCQDVILKTCLYLDYNPYSIILLDYYHNLLTDPCRKSNLPLRAIMVQS